MTVIAEECPSRLTIPGDAAGGSVEAMFGFARSHVPLSQQFRWLRVVHERDFSKTISWTLQYPKNKPHYT